MKGYKPYTGRKRGWQLIAALVGLLIIAVVAIVLSAKAGADKYIRWNVERNRELLTMGCTYAELDKTGQDKTGQDKPETASPKQTETTKASAPETAKPKQAETEPDGTDNVFKIYAYCPCEKCCGSGASGITATGTTATAGRTIAVDPDVIPLGSVVIIGGNEYIAEDTGSGIKGKTIDLYMDSHEAALEWGVRYLEVTTNCGAKMDGGVSHAAN